MSDAEEQIVTETARALRYGTEATKALATLQDWAHRKHLEDLARPYQEFIEGVVAHFAKGRAELIEKACQMSMTDLEGRGVLVMDWEDKTTVLLSRTVPYGTVAYRDYRGAKAPQRIIVDEASGIPTIIEDPTSGT